MRKIKNISLLLLVVGLVIASLYYWISVQYEDKIIALLKTGINENVKTEITTDNIRVSPFMNFPDISVEFRNLLVKAHKPEALAQQINDTLLFTQQLVVSVNLKSLLQNEIQIEQIWVKNGDLNIVSSGTENNYSIFQPQQKPQQNKYDLKIDNFVIENVSFTYLNLNANYVVHGLIDKHKIKLKQQQDAIYAKNKVSLSGLGLQTNKKNVFSNVKLKADISINYLDNVLEIFNSKVNIDRNNVVLNGLFSSQDKSKTNLRAEGDFQNIFSFIQYFVPDFKTAISGRVKITSNLHWDTKNEKYFVESTIQGYNIDFKVENLDQLNLDFKAEHGAHIENFSTSTVTFKSLKLSYGESTLFSTDVKLSQLVKPSVYGNFNATLSYKDINALKNSDLYTINSGQVKASFLLHGELGNVKKVELDNVLELINNYKINVGNLNIGLNKHNKDLYVEYFTCHGLNDMRIDSAFVKFGESTVKGSGNVANFKNLFLKSKTKFYLDLQSDYINYNDLSVFFAKKEHTENTDDVSDKINVFSNFSVHTFQYNNMAFKECVGKFKYLGSELNIQLQRAALNDGTISGSVDLLSMENRNNKISISSEVNNVNLNYIFTEFDNFKQDFITADHIDGQVFGDFEIGFKYKNDFSGIFKESIVMNSTVIVKNGVLSNFDPVLKLSNHININELKEIHFLELKNDIYILDEVIYIPEMQVNSSALNLHIAGEHGFNSSYEYNFRLRLFELLAKKFRSSRRHEELNINKSTSTGGLELFFTLTGDAVNSEVKYNKSAHKEQLKNDLKQEKKNVKSILNNEFGWYSKSADSVNTDDKGVLKEEKNEVEKTKHEKSDFIIEWDDE